jgi:hypothetical protein
MMGQSDKTIDRAYGMKDRVLTSIRKVTDPVNRSARKVPGLKLYIRMLDKHILGLSPEEWKSYRMIEEARAGRADSTQKLVEKGALPDMQVPRKKMPSWMNPPDTDGTFLHWAASSVNSDKALHRIAVVSEDINAPRADGHTALSLAAINNSEGTLFALSTLGADPDQRINGKDMVTAVADAGSFQGAQYLKRERDNCRVMCDATNEERDMDAASLQEEKLQASESEWQQSASQKVVSLSSANRARLEKKRAAMPIESREAAVQRIARLKLRQKQLAQESRIAKKQSPTTSSKPGSER